MNRRYFIRNTTTGLAGFGILAAPGCSNATGDSTGRAGLKLRLPRRRRDVWLKH